MAEKEKALVDYLYFVSLRKSPHYERLFANLKDRNYYRIKTLNREKINMYIKLFENKQLLNLVNFLL